MKRTPAKKPRNSPKKVPRKSGTPPDETNDETPEFVRFPRKVPSATSTILSSFAWMTQKEFEQGDQLAPFNFAALYVKLESHPSDIPEWVAHYFVSAMGKWALDTQAKKPPFNEIAKLRRKRKFFSGLDKELLYLSRVRNHTKSARAAIKANNGPTYTIEPNPDEVGKRGYGEPIPIPKNTFSNGREICRIIGDNSRVTKAFQIMLARQCGITGRSGKNTSDEAIYQAVLQIRKRHRARKLHQSLVGGR